MPRGPKKPVVLAIKVPEDLAEFLDRLPNKSEFVRQAILAQMQMACPLCDGLGFVARGIGDHYRPVLDRHQTKECGHCLASEVIQFELSSVPVDDRPRWEQFFQGGPYFCAACFADTEVCSCCGWRLTLELLRLHAER